MLAGLIINTVAAALFLTGIVDVSEVPSLYATLPLAVVFYGTFVIFLIMEKETAQFDAEQRALHGQGTPGKHSESADSTPGHEHLHAHGVHKWLQAIHHASGTR